MKPLPEDVFVCRWRDWLFAVRHDEARLAAFARHMLDLEPKIDIRLRALDRPLREGYRR
jgi:hypothetical protein